MPSPVTLPAFRAFGLDIRSEFALPELLPGAGGADLEIVAGEVPKTLADVTETGVRYQAAPGRLLLRVDGIARYLVEEGRLITVRPEPGALEEDVRLFLLGSALGAALHQRGDLVLHGSAIVANGAAVAFLGLSGVGKSTLAMEFRRRGHGVLTDDLCVVRRGPDGILRAEPGFPQSKLWLDSLRHLDISAEGLRRIRSELEKRALPLGEEFAAEAYPLRRIYVLLSQAKDEITFHPLTGPAKFSAVRNHTYRFRFVAGLGQRPAHFETGAALARQAAIVRVQRSRNRFRLEELADRVAEDFAA